MGNREKRLIAVLLSITMVFTMDSAVFAVSDQVVEEEDVQQGSTGLSDEMTTETDSSEWRAESAELSSSDKGWNKTTVSSGTVESFSVRYLSDVETFSYAKGYEIRYEGCYNSGDLWIEEGRREKNNEIEKAYFSASNNKVTVSISMGELGEDDYKISQLVIKYRKPVHYKYYNSYGPGIEKGCVSFQLENGLKLNGPYYMNVYPDPYYYWVVTCAYPKNCPTARKTVTVGDYDITYYSEIPYFGKKNTVKNKEICISGSKYNYLELCFRKIVISDNKTGFEYEADKVKVVRLKDAPLDQGPYPKIPNAGLQILKFKKYDSKNRKEIKKIQKDIKNLTKVDTQKSRDEQALPLIIYPRRVRNIKTTGKRNLVGGILEGKKGKYRFRIPMAFFTSSYNPYKYETDREDIFLSYGGSLKFKNGEKDSFKTGVHSINVMKNSKGQRIVSINSADIWTGPDGFVLSDFTDRSKR